MAIRVALPEGAERTVHLRQGEGLVLLEGNPLRIRGATDLVDVMAASAAAVAAGLVHPEASVPVRTALATDWGVLAIEVHGGPRKPATVLVEAPPPTVEPTPVPAVMAAMALGWPRAAISEKEAPIRVVRCWKRALVAYLADPAGLADLAEPKAESLQRFGADAAVAYALTQRRPYIKVRQRCWGLTRGEATLVSGAHVVGAGLVRPTFPMTRVMDDPSRVEAHLHLEPAGHGARVRLARVGGPVEATVLAE